MSNVCRSGFCIIHHSRASSFPSKRRAFAPKFINSFSSFCPLILTHFPSCSSSSSVILARTSALVLASSDITPSNIPQRSEEWFALRKDKLTTSTFSTALGFWKGTRRAELWHEKVFASDPETNQAAKLRAMEWGTLNEEAAISRYKTITGNDVGSLGFAVHSEERLHWLGASPDGLLGCFPNAGILEVKCPYNKGKPELALPWSNIPFYYMPQVQGQMEIMGREWVDLYCWTQNGSTIFRVYRDRGYWDLIHGMLREFWWDNVVPAREALLMGKEEEEVFEYKPASVHKKTGLAISNSLKLAGEAKLLCKEIAGHVEFYR